MFSLPTDCGIQTDNCSVMRPVMGYNTSTPLALLQLQLQLGGLGSRVVSMMDSGADGPGFKSQPRRCPVTVLGKLFKPIVSLFTKQRNW